MRRLEILVAVLLMASACGNAPSAAHYEKIRACWAEADVIATQNAMRMAQYNTSREIRALTVANLGSLALWYPESIPLPILKVLPDCESVARDN